ncbi:MAG: SGNH/GDSL hydrolase family protein [Myxococcota bacterium]
MRKSDRVREATRRGRASAEAVAKAHRTTQRRRTRAAATSAARDGKARAEAVARAPSPEARRAAGPPHARGVLVAEGDSWFDYPLYDVLVSLEDDHDFAIESVAHRGDRVESMAYADGQLDALCRRIEKVVRGGEIPRAILLSGGGNDLVGRPFELLLDHARSPIAGLNESVVRGVIDERIFLAYVHMISAITRLGDALTGHRIPIVTHGYAYAVPDGRGFLGGWWVLPGPWLKPGFDAKGFHDVRQNARVVRTLIDRFHAMLERVAALRGFGHVRYVDLRDTLSSDATWRRSWADELHPSRSGFARVAKKIAEAIP